MNDLLIHIGYHKTGTTWLQNKVFTDKSSLFFSLSKESSGPSTLAECFIKDSDGYMLSNFDNNKIKIEEELAEIRNQKSNLLEKFPVFSHEELSGNPHGGGFMSKAIADRIKTIFPNAKILIVIREQKSFILSNYFQYLTIGGNKSLNDILNTTFDFRIPSFSPNNIRYNELISYYYELFGENRVLVLPYEMFQQNPESFIEKIGAFIQRKIEIPLSEFSAKENKKGNLYLNYHFRFLNVFTKKTSVNNYSSFKNRITRRLSLIFIAILKFFIPASWDKSIQTKLEKDIANWSKGRYRQPNEALSALIKIDLRQYGYLE